MAKAKDIHMRSVLHRPATEGTRLRLLNTIQWKAYSFSNPSATPHILYPWTFAALEASGSDILSARNATQALCGIVIIFFKLRVKVSGVLPLRPYYS